MNMLKATKVFFCCTHILKFKSYWFSFISGYMGGRSRRKFLRDSLCLRSFLIAAKTRYSGFFQFSLVTRFASDIGQLARIWI